MAKRQTNQQIAILPEGVDPNAPPELPPPVLTPTPMPSGNIPSTRQTLSFIRNLLYEHGLEPKNKLGQNYLIDLNMLDLLVRSAELGTYDSVLEVGTGTGTLTMKLGELAGSVLTIEIDREFYRLVQPMLKARPNVMSMLGDALAGKNVLNEEMMNEWGRVTGEYGCSQRKLIANLPYAVATPIISNLLLQDDFEIERMVVMVQWEIAERMRAEMGTKEYNSLSVLVQSVADVDVIRKVGPANFFPRPQVDSAIVCIKPNPEKRKRVGNVRKFREFLRDLYTLRRKNLRSALAGWPRGKNDKAEVDRKLQEVGIDGGVRAEALTVEEHLELCAVFG